MIIGTKVGSKEFSDEDRQKAYLKGCKYFARFVKFPQAYFTIEELKEKELPTFVFTLFTCRDVGTDKNHNCVLCKQFHSSFFLNEFYNCNCCSLNSFLEREKQDLNISKCSFKKKLQKE